MSVTIMSVTSLQTGDAVILDPCHVQVRKGTQASALVHYGHNCLLHAEFTVPTS